MDVIVNKAEQKLLKLSADPETRREYEAREKALSDERSRLKDAEDNGILKVVQSLLNSGMTIAEASKHTPYSEDELKRLLKIN